MKPTIKVDPMGYEDPFRYYCNHSSNGHRPSFLLESRPFMMEGRPMIDLTYGRQSIVVPNAALKITGKNDTFCLEALTDTGAVILSAFTIEDFAYAHDVRVTEDRITGKVKKGGMKNLTELERIRQPNTSFIIRTVLEKFPELRDDHAGLYGAFAYDFARNFDDFGKRFSERGEPDFSLFLPTTVVYFDDVFRTAEVKRFFFDGKNDDLDGEVLTHGFQPLPIETYEDMTLDEYEQKVADIIEQIKAGRLLQCVLSRNQGMTLQQHPIDSYATLRDINPSPYSYFTTLGDRKYLYGASPELHIKVTNGEVEIRPIAGTVQRGKTPLQHHQAEVKLKTDSKELREHTMLVDLARHEIYRLADARSVEITDLFSLEYYPNLIHLVSGVKGRLKRGIDALDALLTTIPAGTLSGAPKLEAMMLIEQLESSRRDYYGGAIGYVAFNGNCNTGINIRSVFVNGNYSYMRAGAGVVAHSTPRGERREIGIKSARAMEALRCA